MEAILGEDNNLSKDSLTGGCVTSTGSKSSGISSKGLFREGGSANKIVGKSAISSPSSEMTILLPSLTSPITADTISCLSQISLAFSTSLGFKTNTILSWDSDNIISYGVIPVSLNGIERKSTNAALSDSSTSSEIQHVRPPPPKSLTPLTLIFSNISSDASSTLFLVNGSATCTAGLSSVSESDVNSSEANVTP